MAFLSVLLGLDSMSICFWIADNTYICTYKGAGDVLIWGRHAKKTASID